VGGRITACRRAHRGGRELWGTSATGMMLHARGIEQHTKGVDNVLAAINLGLADRQVRQAGCGVSTITGQGNGQGGREHGTSATSCPATATSPIPSIGRGGQGVEL
jgi:assimilatory nitrate reductase catalytic subunit